MCSYKSTNIPRLQDFGYEVLPFVPLNRTNENARWRSSLRQAEQEAERAWRQFDAAEPENRGMTLGVALGSDSAAPSTSFVPGPKEFGAWRANQPPHRAILLEFARQVRKSMTPPRPRLTPLVRQTFDALIATRQAPLSTRGLTLCVGLLFGLPPDCYESKRLKI
jgi:hypothetical protein